MNSASTVSADKAATEKIRSEVSIAKIFKRLSLRNPTGCAAALTGYG